MNQLIHEPIFITQNNSYNKLHNKLIMKLSPLGGVIKRYELHLIDMILIKVTVICNDCEISLDNFSYTKWNRELMNQLDGSKGDIVCINDYVICNQLVPDYKINSYNYLDDVKDINYRTDIEIHFATFGHLFMSDVDLEGVKFEVRMIDVIEMEDEDGDGGDGVIEIFI